jgi:tRNA A-37 threonylcarbamoyl transferase component Bud32
METVRRKVDNVPTSAQFVRMSPFGTNLRSSRMVRLVTRVPLMLSRHLWVWPLAGALLFGAVGLWVRSRVETTIKAELASRLQTLVKANLAALRLWFSEQEADAKSFAADIRIQGAIVELAAMESGATPSALADSESARTLDLYLKPLLETQHYLDYVVIGADRRVLASARRYQIGRPAPLVFEAFVTKVLAGQVAVSRPMAQAATLSQRAEGPTMFVAAPVKAPDGKIVAVLALRMKPEEEFTQIFSVARMGQTREAYAFDQRAVMLTASRFDAELQKAGLITNTPEATTILNLRLQDPGVDLELEDPAIKPLAMPLRPPGPRRITLEHPPGTQPVFPLTRMAASAIRGHDGVDVEGYRNYRGSRVVGAWAWLSDYEMGVATEVAANEAFQTLYVLRQAFLVLFILLVLSGAAIFAFTLLVERLQSSARRGVRSPRRLGPYVLMQEIGHGANGRIFRARHALLRRPVAIKVLGAEMADEATAARFEHEVQMTSQLTHPNTVAIYDYGRSPDGLFYYAMEYLSGIDLDQLVRRFGPQAEGRVIHILRQICGSLAEAHANSLIHRDIKPANIILTRRGGICDLVKVLDFGLVKAVHAGAADTPGANSVVGTPHFMSPEAVKHPDKVDGRSDLYSVAAVGYWLLTGKTMFEETKVEALLELQVGTMPQPPSKRAGRPISPDLEHLIMQCLEKSPERRPDGAAALDEALGHCASAGAWTRLESENWWLTNYVGIEVQTEAAMAEKTLIIAPRR